MAITIDSALGFIIPALIIITLAVAIGAKFENPMSRFFNWMRELFGWTKEKMDDGGEYLQEEIVYR